MYLHHTVTSLHNVVSTDAMIHLFQPMSYIHTVHAYPVNSAILRHKIMISNSYSVIYMIVMIPLLNFQLFLRWNRIALHIFFPCKQNVCILCVAGAWCGGDSFQGIAAGIALLPSAPGMLSCY